MIAEQALSHIQARLQQVADEEGVRILFAAESGSRAWGFASPDSDYDVRFVYAHPREWYIRLDEGRDVIERPIDDQLVDLSGWDVRKALRLLLKSNPVLFEWFSSPVIYRDDGAFRPATADLFTRHASPLTLAHHYAATATSHWKRNIAGQDQVRLKRYLYVLRPVLALQWVITHRTPPPMNMDALFAPAIMPASVRATVEDLLRLKRSTPELGLGPRLAALDGWLEAELARLDPRHHDLADEGRSGTRTEADHLFRTTIGA